MRRSLCFVGLLIVGTAAAQSSNGSATTSPAVVPGHAMTRICGAVTTPTTSRNGLCFSEEPLYPPEAKAKRIQGTVHLRALIGVDGRVKQVTALDGDPLLVPAAERAVRRWTYKPYKKHGKPIEMETTITVNFTLSES